MPPGGRNHFVQKGGSLGFEILNFGLKISESCIFEFSDSPIPRFPDSPIALAAAALTDLVPQSLRRRPKNPQTLSSRWRA
jgi:hypothetical protein